MKSRKLSQSMGSRAALILGDGLSSRLLALRLRVRYGVSALVCDQKASALCVLLPLCRFIRLYHENDGGVIVRKLEDIAAYDEERLLFLVSANAEYDQFVASRAEYLEDKFIITDKKGIVPFLNAYGEV